MTPLKDLLSMSVVENNYRYLFLQEVAEDSIVKKKVQVSSANDAFDGFTLNSK